MVERYLAAALLALGYVGWLLWMLRRRSGEEAVSANGVSLVVWASQSGLALAVAQRAAESLGAARLLALDQLDGPALAAARRVWLIVSTTGTGDPPDHAWAFVRETMPQPIRLEHVRYALLALGDRAYPDFCGFGRRLDDWMRQRGAQPLFDRIDVDKADPLALRRWQLQLARWAPEAASTDVPSVLFEPWRLQSRRQLNPGSVGAAVFQLTLSPPPGARWQAGDIAEIRIPGQPPVSRPYSIASCPQEATLQLLVRRQQSGDGRPGIGSGWLCDQAVVDDDIAVHIRHNPNFHAPAASTPLILIGNGTGIAGLRALLAARVASGARRNWLLFGERQRSRDFFYREDIEHWQHQGFIEHLDLAFSRDGGSTIHVQDALRAQQLRLQAWLRTGAALYVCGSRAGMAEGVDALLRELLGEQPVDAMLGEGRYRREIY